MKVHLSQFEGPLSLLLYLIRREEMDIYDIPIHRITQQYLDHIKIMNQLDLEGAGEFIAMAATLIHIKSKMLLPVVHEEGAEEPEDPRKELVKKLLDYQKYKDISKTLNERPLVGRDIWTRGRKESLSLLEGDIVLEENALYNMISLYRKSIRSFQKRAHKVVRKGQSIASRIMEIKDRLVVGTRITVRSLITSEEITKTKVVVTFLSILELSKMGFLSLFQSEPYADIFVETKQFVDGNVITRVEEYDSAGAEAAAAKMFENENEDLAFDVIEDASQLNLLDQENLEAENAESSAAAEALLAEKDFASDDEILSAEMEMGLGDIEQDIEYQAEKAVTELKSIDEALNEPDILEEITNRFEGNVEGGDFDPEVSV
jgi:segregation and condensation protein A